MKRICIFILAWMIFLPCQSIGPNIPTYPIPSYNIEVIGMANFINNNSSCENSRGRRNLIIRIKAGTLATTECSATVWAYSLNQQTILGPYHVQCGETLRIEVDNDDWGAIVESDSLVEVDIWYE